MVEYSSTVIESVFVLPSTDCMLYILIQSCYHTMVPVVFVFEKLQFSFYIDPGLSFLKPCLSLKKVGKHKGTNWTRSATLHLFPYCKDLVFMQLTAEVELIVRKQKDPVLVFIWSDKFSEVFVEEVCILNSPLCFLTANLK